MTAPSQSELSRYWVVRKDLLYNRVAQSLAEAFCEAAQSVLDVGSGACPSLDWLPNVPKRVSVDLRTPYAGPGVTPVIADFLEWEPGELFDVVMCLQVLEHIPRADLFARRLLAVAKTAIVSVPYRWTPGRVRTHVQDPVDEAKLFSWFGREPNFSYVCHEVKTDAARLVVVYEPNDLKWADLAERKRALAKLQPAPPLAGAAAARRAEAV
jgi:hypothetical protein